MKKFILFIEDFLKLFRTIPVYFHSFSVRIESCSLYQLILITRENPLGVAALLKRNLKENPWKPIHDKLTSVCAFRTTNIT